jgi:beta-aspartyl-peptidase (threonine type)
LYMRTLFVFSLTIGFMSMAATASAQKAENVFTRRVGLSEITLLSESQGQGNKSILIGATPEMLQQYAPEGVFPMGTNAFFVKTPDRNILVDAGYGRNLFNSLQEIGITPGQVDIVLLTHMHGDHIGGMLRDGKPSFPNAHVYIAQPEIEYWQDSSRGQQARDVIAAYRDRLHVFQPDEVSRQGAPLTDGIRAIAAYGHTPGHTAFLLESGSEKLLIWGDLAHAMAIQMPCPQVAVTYDADPKDAVACRMKILEYAEKNRIPVAGMHIPFPGMGTVAKDEISGGYTFTPIPLNTRPREYALVIHGGAGNLSATAGDPVRAPLIHAAMDSALQIGERILSGGGAAEDAVLAVVSYLEDNPLFNAGKGATVTAEGAFELDAAIMLGNGLRAGAVAGVKTVKNPIRAACAVMTQSPHVMLSGEGAGYFAAAQGLEIVDNAYFATPRTLEWIEQLKKESGKNGTVGCVALDRHGNLAAGTSTGGMLRKRWGRIGDAPVIGAGTYADNNSCAVSCTGHGEYFIRHAVAFNLCARYKYLHETVAEAAGHIIHHELNADEGNGGLIALDKDGNIAMPFNSAGMIRASLYKDKDAPASVRRTAIGKQD